VQTPNFSEFNHPVVKSLFHHSDQELLTLFQNHPDQGRFFTAIFCRYAQIVHSLIRHSCDRPYKEITYLPTLGCTSITNSEASICAAKSKSLMAKISVSKTG
jgi:hypothetical protein